MTLTPRDLPWPVRWALAPAAFVVFVGMGMLLVLLTLMIILVEVVKDPHLVRDVVEDIISKDHLGRRP